MAHPSFSGSAKQPDEALHDGAEQPANHAASNALSATPSKGQL